MLSPPDSSVRQGCGLRWLGFVKQFGVTLPLPCHPPNMTAVVPTNPLNCFSLPAPFQVPGLARRSLQDCSSGKCSSVFCLLRGVLQC